MSEEGEACLRSEKSSATYRFGVFVPFSIFVIEAPEWFVGGLIFRFPTSRNWDCQMRIFPISAQTLNCSGDVSVETLCRDEQHRSRPRRRYVRVQHWLFLFVSKRCIWRDIWFLWFIYSFFGLFGFESFSCSRFLQINDRFVSRLIFTDLLFCRCRNCQRSRKNSSSELSRRIDVEVQTRRRPINRIERFRCQELLWWIDHCQR